jgi:hypothetical protein
MGDKITVELTQDEAEHMISLMAKDIGWHLKYHNLDKAKTAREIYRKIKASQGATK